MIFLISHRFRLLAIATPLDGTYQAMRLTVTLDLALARGGGFYPSLSLSIGVVGWWSLFIREREK